VLAPELAGLLTRNHARLLMYGPTGPASSRRKRMGNGLDSDAAIVAGWPTGRAAVWTAGFDPCPTVLPEVFIGGRGSAWLP
jgi:hypothetical protein